MSDTVLPARLKAALAQHYRVERPLGAGGMATVYLARDVKHDRDVALKVLRPELAATLGAERFLAEIRITAALDHPHILTLLDSGESDGFLWYVLPYVRGESLRSRLNREGQLPLNDALVIARQIASALDYAHRHGIIHRDIKPENILLFEGEAMLTDFGIALAVGEVAGARLTETGFSVGTPQYMSPEQATGRPLDARSDVYSLGAVVYEMLAGEPPHSGATAQAVIAKLLSDRPTPLRTLRDTVPEAIESAIAKALVKVPADRFASAAQFASALEVTPGTNQSAPAAVRATSHLRLLAAATAALLVLGAVWWGAASLSPGAAPRPRVSSLAVLPLDNLSGDATQDYLSEGMTEALIAALGKIGSLRVPPRSSVMKYKATAAPLRDVARDLQVDALVTGSVLRSGDRVGITVQLIDPNGDQQIWTQRYERNIRDVLALHSEVAQTVAGEVRATVTPLEERRLAASQPVHPEAYESFLRARYLGDRTTESELQAAITQLERAVMLDPGFAPAYAELASAYVRQLTFVAPEQAIELEQKAFAAAERAIALDAGLADAYVARGDLLWTPAHRFPHARAAEEFRKALALNPNLEHAHRGMSRVLVHVGFLKEGLEHAEKAIAINPGNGFSLMMRVEALQWMGDYAAALATLSRVPAAALPELREAYTVWSLLMLNRREEAASRLEQAWRRYRNDPSGNLASVQALLLSDTNPAKARALIAEVARREAVNTSHHASYFVGAAWARMGRAKEAVEWFRETAETGFPCYPLFANDPTLDPIREDPAFKSFLSDMEHNMASLRKALFPAGT